MRSSVSSFINSNHLTCLFIQDANLILILLFVPLYFCFSSVDFFVLFRFFSSLFVSVSLPTASRNFLPFYLNSEYVVSS